MHGETFTHITFYTEKLLHKGAFTVTQTQKSLYTEKLLHGESATQRNLSHRASFYTKKNYTQKLLHRETVTQSKLYTKQGFTQRNFHTKTAFPPRRQSGKTTILKHFLKEISKQNHQRQSEEESAAKAPFATFMQPLQYALYAFQLQKTLAYYARSRSREEP